MERIPLPALPRELRALGVHVTYQRLWNIASAGEIAEIERSATGRLSIRREDLRAVARQVRLIMQEAA